MKNEQRIQDAIETLRQIEHEVQRACNRGDINATQANIDNIVRIYCAQLELPL